jgi:hypothetical protein
MQHEEFFSWVNITVLEEFDALTQGHKTGFYFGNNVTGQFLMYLTRRTLKPVGHQSTNWMVRLVFMVAIAAFTSFGTTSPL